jgi:hypothetical protein
MEQQFEITRQVVKVKDVMLFFGKKERQSHKLIAAVKLAFNKKPKQPVTVNEFCSYWGFKPSELQVVMAKVDKL